jgi:hypothetical protein
MLMWVFTIVTVTGIYGLVIQQIFPTRLLRGVSMETIYEQIDRIVGQLRGEAKTLIASLDEHLEEEQPYELDAIPAGSAAAVAVMERTTSRSARQLKEFYDREVVALLQDDLPRSAALADPVRANQAFIQLRDAMPPGLRKTAETLADICEERRQLAKQKKLHHWLHGWLLLHVPAAYGMFVLIAVHIYYALRYTTIGG